jgi:hypothetical protein
MSREINSENYGAAVNTTDNMIDSASLQIDGLNCNCKFKKIKK